MLPSMTLLLLPSLALAAPPPTIEPDFTHVILNRKDNATDDYPDFTNAILARGLEQDDRAINTCGCASVPSTSR